jgi:hypothetical protein
MKKSVILSLLIISSLFIILGAVVSAQQSSCSCGTFDRAAVYIDGMYIGSICKSFSCNLGGGGGGGGGSTAESRCSTAGFDCGTHDLYGYPNTDCGSCGGGSECVGGVCKIIEIDENSNCKGTCTACDLRSTCNDGCTYFGGSCVLSLDVSICGDAAYDEPGCLDRNELLDCSSKSKNQCTGDCEWIGSSECYGSCNHCSTYDTENTCGTTVNTGALGCYWDGGSECDSCASNEYCSDGHCCEKGSLGWNSRANECYDKVPSECPFHNTCDGFNAFKNFGSCFFSPTICVNVGYYYGLFNWYEQYSVTCHFDDGSSGPC